MAPSYRNANRRQNRPGVDHGEYEGIPIRHWRRDFVTVAPPPIPDSSTTQNDIWAVELPHGMPKDSHLLPQHSQDLLRAARSGKIYKRPAPADEEEADPETVIGDKPEKKDEDLKEKGFTAKSWKQVPRHMEGPDVVYLAKRRKGLVTATSRPVPVATVTKATVKRIDAAGNEYVQDVVVPLGAVVEGEVISQIQIPDPNAPAGLAAVQATPPRPRQKPKKKAKGPGRGRKKKPIAPTSVPQAPLAEGVAPLPTAEGTAGPDGIKVEAEPNSTPALNEDTEMADGSAANSDDDDDDDGEDGEEGDDNEGSLDGQESPSKPSQPSPMVSAPSLPPIPPLDQRDIPMGGTEFPHAPPKLQTDRSEGMSGSPLKNVVMPTSTPTSTHTSPVEPPSDRSLTTSFPSIHPLAIENTSSEAIETKVEQLNEEMQQEVPDLAPEVLPLPPPEPTIIETNAAVEERIAEEEEEEMILDILDKAKNSEVGAPDQDSTISPIPAPQSPLVEATPVQMDSAPPLETNIEQTQAEPERKTVPEPDQVTAPPVVVQDAAIQQENVPSPAPATVLDPAPIAVPEPAPEPPLEVTTQETAQEDDEDDFPDLLGGLEKSLGARPATPTAAPLPGDSSMPEEEKESDVPGIIAEEVSQEGKPAEENDAKAEENDSKVEPNSQGSEEMLL
ncbi:hypothetical protein VTL71DRAFT_3324 [Oculimacula yallundae]|uniref:Lyr family protein n=1 Tax=Oculimacula yallundae TaxID=86028 RepID=A0ABR4C6W7_9HELO